MDGDTVREAFMGRHARYLVFIAFGLFAPTTATAQTPIADPAAKLRLGLNLVPMPFGTAKVNLGALGTPSSDTAFAFGVMPAVDYALNPFFFVGFAPQLTF